MPEKAVIMASKPLLIIKTGKRIDSLADHAGDYEHWIAQGMGWPWSEVRVADVQLDARLPDYRDIAGVVITGSGSMVTEQADWMNSTAQWLKQAVPSGLPCLGICFGHQILAHALGGQVDYNPRGIEVGSVSLSCLPAAHNDALFAAFSPQFVAQVSHSQSVIELPPGAVHLAESALEKHHGFRWGERAWGIQFHPEFDETIIPHFIEYYRARLADQGVFADELLKGVMPGPQSQQLLTRFASLV